MAIAKWAAPGARSSNFAGTTLNSLADGSESSVVTYDNSTNRDLQGAVTIKLGSITPGTGVRTVTLRITSSDGTDVSDRVGGAQYICPLLSGTGAKVIVLDMVRLPPFSLRFSLINNSGATLSASGNELYVRPFNEDVT